MLVSEGKVRLDDKVISFFPEYDTDEVGPLVRDYTVEDALMMATPFFPTRPKAEADDTTTNPFAKQGHKPSGRSLSVFISRI